MALFRVTVTRWVDNDGRRVKAGTPGARKVRKKSRKWYGEWTDERGKLVRKPLSANKTVAGQLLREALDAVERARVGWAPTPQAGVPPPPPASLGPLLDAYRAELASGVGRRRPSADWLARELARLRRCLDGMQAATPAGISLAAARVYLAALGKDGAPAALPEGQEEFTPAQARALLGVSSQALTWSVRRHRLAVSGQGRARRYPRVTLAWLASRAARGAGRSTLRLHARTLRSFSRWLVARGALAADPLAELYVGVTEADHRKVRRALTVLELARLLEAARASERAWRGLDGPARCTLYLTACSTGFRAGALAGLTPEDFDLVAQTVRLAARGNKSRRVKLQPLPPGVAALLGPWLASRPAGQPLWPGRWIDHPADMLGADLDAAGIPRALPSLDGPQDADFHALRHTYLTQLGRAGVDLRTLQELAGHSTPVLTARYSHREQGDLAQAVLRFPVVAAPVAGASAPDRPPLAATGSDGPPATGPALSFPPGEGERRRQAQA